jgi:hypothetical protein
MSSYEAVLSCPIIHYNFTIDWFAVTTLPLPLAENDEVTLSLLVSSLNFFHRAILFQRAHSSRRAAIAADAGEPGRARLRRAARLSCWPSFLSSAADYKLVLRVTAFSSLRHATPRARTQL